MKTTDPGKGFLSLIFELLKKAQDHVVAVRQGNTQVSKEDQTKNVVVESDQAIA